MYRTKDFFKKNYHILQNGREYLGHKKDLQPMNTKVSELEDFFS